MHFIMLPTETLRDADATPFILCKEAKDMVVRWWCKQVFRDQLEQGFG